MGGGLLTIAFHLSKLPRLVSTESILHKPGIALAYLTASWSAPVFTCTCPAFSRNLPQFAQSHTWIALIIINPFRMPIILV